MHKDDDKYYIFILFLLAGVLPIWANVQAFYTDNMSFAAGIIALALCKCALESRSGGKSMLLLAGASVFAGIGIAVKVTVAIPLIAGFIVLCFYNHPRKFRMLLCFLLVTLGTYEMTTLWAGNYEIWEAAKETGEPIIDWIALGMKGNGTWQGNSSFISYAITLPTKAEKVEYAKAYIWENRGDFINLSHLIQKARTNFASGSFGVKDFTYYAMDANNIVWELFSPWGKYYWRTSQLSFCYIFAIYAAYLVGAALTVRDFLKKRPVSAVKMIADLALLGNIIFLMLWEANNRQLYNQVPVILVGGVWNARRIAASVQRFSKRSKYGHSSGLRRRHAGKCA